MAEIFICANLAKLLENKYVVIMGDSVQRCIYKDMICALQKDKFLTDKDLRNKGEQTLYKDELLEGGRLGQMTNGTSYREVRQYHTDYHLVRFYFVTRCYNKYIEKMLKEIKEFSVQPDVFIMNSCLWDISRYGANGVQEYQKNLLKLMNKLKSILPEACVVLWNSTLPISSNAKGGFIIPEVEALTSTLRLDIIHANNYARKVIMEAGYDLLDLHFFLTNHLHRRAGDGIHWDMTAHRRITNLIMTQISEAWGIDLPHNTKPEMINPSVLSQGQDEDNLGEKALSDAIKARPKAKARRRMRNRGIAAMRNPSLGLLDNPYIQSPCSLPGYRPATNLPIMVDPMERYGGPIAAASFDSSAQMLSPFNRAHGFNNRPRVLFNGLHSPAFGLNGQGFMSQNTELNTRSFFPGEQNKFGGPQTGGHSRGFADHVNDVANQALGFGRNRLANKNDQMSIYSLNSQQSTLLTLDGQRYSPGFSQFHFSNN